VDYGKIAGILETSEANSRQLVSRARKRIREERPRFTVDRQHHLDVLQRFLAACNEGDVAGLAAALRDDVVLYSDGGGKVAAALNPIVGSAKVIRLLLGLLKRQQHELSAGYITDINGVPG